MKETYALIEGTNNCWVSSLGRFFHLYSTQYGEAIVPVSASNGYERIGLLYEGRPNPIYKYAHRVIAKTFIPRPSNLHNYVQFIDPLAQDRLRVDNIVWVQRSEIPTNNSNEESIRVANEIRSRFAEPNAPSQAQLAREFGLSRSMVHRIIKGERCNDAT